MATIKSFTSLEQSKKLAEFLPLESADMHIGNYVGESGKVDGTNIHYYPKGESFGAPQIIDAWSLAALLDVLPKGTNISTPKPINALSYCCWNQYDEIYADNPIDACYEMILKLNELNLL